MFTVSRYKHNPILSPDSRYAWQALATFNGCPIRAGLRTHLFFRALSLEQYDDLARERLSFSTIGHAASLDGFHYSNPKQFIVPEHQWERFGCEDPRVTKLDGMHYIFYTALSTYPFSAPGIKVAVALSKNLKTVDEKHLVTPFNAKAMTLFPKKIQGRMAAILSVDTDQPPSKTGIIYFDEPEQMWNTDHWWAWYKDIDTHTINLKREEDDHIEIGAPPVLIDRGWLLIYSHINHYGKEDVLFGIEAVILDRNNPKKIIDRTYGPIMMPDAYNELYGMVPNVIFPSGALRERKNIHIFYGATDTTCNAATIPLADLLIRMKKPEEDFVKMERCNKDPIIEPISEHPWEDRTTFNPAAFYAEGKVHIVYRAQSMDGTSVFGYAVSNDGITVAERLSEPIYTPRAEFEQKKGSGNSGCEDARTTVIGNTLYMLYTAFDGINVPRVALTSIPLESFLNRRWDKWSDPVLISPPGLDDKDACLFPEKVNGKYLIFHRIAGEIDIAFTDTLHFDDSRWIDEYRWMRARREYWDNEKVGIASPPMRTPKGWVLLYHGVSKEDHIYRVGAVMMDLKDPTHIIGRTDGPLLEPEEEYEKVGEIPNVVFPCGSVILDDTILTYYGGADQVINVAKISLKDMYTALHVR